MGILRPYTHYSKAFIERQANVLLQQMESTPFAPTWPLESASVADFLDLGVVWDCIPPDGAGDIAARILPTQRMIEINETILDMSQGFIESTLSHEIGHWVLHIDGDAVDAEDLEDEDEPFVCRGATDEGQLAYEFASTEWQAQHFAACLLMPQFVLQQKLRWRRSDRWPDLYEIKDELGVTIANLLYRLQDLGWVHFDQKTKKLTKKTSLSYRERMLGY